MYLFQNSMKSLGMMADANTGLVAVVKKVCLLNQTVQGFIE